MVTSRGEKQVAAALRIKHKPTAAANPAVQQQQQQTIQDLYVQERRKAALDIKVLLLQNKLKEEFPTVEMFEGSREFIICSLVPIIYKNIKEASKKQKRRKAKSVYEKWKKLFYRTEQLSTPLHQDDDNQENMHMTATSLAAAVFGDASIYVTEQPSTPLHNLEYDGNQV
jgi:hypothetical protein